MSARELIGTWRVATFERYDKDGVASQPLGVPPCGYAVFDQTGHAFIQLGKAASPGVAAEEVAQSLMAYFGPFSVNDGGDVVTVTVESSTIPEYVGSTQVRNFTVMGNAMTIGTPGKYQATLQRVR